MQTLLNTQRVVDVRTVDGKVVIASSLICTWGEGRSLTVNGCAEISVFEVGDVWMRGRGAKFLEEQATRYGAVPTEECVEALVAAHADVIPEVALAAVKRPPVSDDQLLVWAGLKRQSG